MDMTTRTGSPLRQRMIEDMRMRKLEPRTQEGYIRAVRKLTVFLKRSPDTATVEDLRNFQLHLVDTGTSPITLNATLTGLKFFFDITLGRGELMARMQPVKLPRTAARRAEHAGGRALIAAARNIKHQAALSVAYGAGLRASEVCRAQGRRRRQPAHGAARRAGQGPQGPLRHAQPGAAAAAARLVARRPCPGQDAARRLAVPGARSDGAADCRQLNRAIHDAAEAARIDKRVPCTRCATASPPTCWSARSTSA